MSYCLCCNSSLLRHFQDKTLYWYCPSCHQAMPEATHSTSSNASVSTNLLGATEPPGWYASQA
ncbi:MAG: hypothetical protein ACPGVO_05385 [Spirulinaceae cyanobacterium]